VETDWILDEVATGLQKLYLLSLDRTPAAELLTGWCEKEALNRDLSEIVRELEPDTREPTEFVLMRVIRDHRSTNISRRLLITRDGSEITVEEMATPIMNEKGYLTGVVMVLRCPSTVAGTEGKTEMSATNSAAIARS